MKVLVACEESQAVTKELRRLGHEAYSCDIIPCSGGHPEWHIQQDVLSILSPIDHGNNTDFIGFETVDGKIHVVDKWDMIIAFPPCTYLTNAGARHLYKGGVLNQERYEKGLEAKEFFLKFWNAPCERIAIENPTPSRVYELPEKTQVIQPWQFGHPFTKRTQLWLKGIEPLEPTNIVEPERTWCPSGSYSGKHNDKHRGMFTKDRAKNRSKTFTGIAKAMAEQWAGENIIKEKEYKQMELAVKEYELPAIIEFNYQELKNELEEKVSIYETMVYTDDQIKDAKADKANLNKLKKALNDERIRMEKEYMVPFNNFKTQINEIISIIDKPVAVIDKQVKAYEEKEKQDKLDAIKNLWGSTDIPAGLKFEKVFQEHWLNKSTSMKVIAQCMDDAVAGFNNAMATLANLPEFSFEAQQMYISCLDVSKALNEAHRLSEVAKKKAQFEAEQARLAAEFEDDMKLQNEAIKKGCEMAAQGKQFVKFGAWLTTEDAIALKEFFNDRNIEFKAI